MSYRPRPGIFHPFSLLRLAAFTLLALPLFLARSHGALEPVGPIITGLTPATGYPGVAVTIAGSSFTTASQVAFNGTPALCWTLDNDTQITAVVPRGASSGPVSVTNAAGTGDSPSAFTMLPVGPGRIACYANRDGFANFDIYAVNPDGSGTARLTTAIGLDAYPVFSPDGTKIAFFSARDSSYEVYLMNADGSGQTNLSNNAADDLVPAFSPDGRKLVFGSRRDGNLNLYTMHVDGSNVTRLTTTAGSDNTPWYSPDGKQIVFASDREEGRYQLYLMNADGSNQVRLTNSAGGNYHPHFSPDGTTIAFSSTRDGNYNVYTIHPDGTGETQLTTDPGMDRCPAYSPDGAQIVFASNRDGNTELYVMQADGSAPTRLTVTPGADEDGPAWVAGVMPLLAGVAIKPDAGNVLLAGNALTYTAVPTWGRDPEYAFTVTLKDILPDRSNHEDDILRDAGFSASPTRTFTATDPGRYTITVTAREQGTTAPTYTKTLQVVVGSPTLTGVAALTADPPSPGVLGALPPDGITLSASATGTLAGVEYFFKASLREIDIFGTITWTPVTLSSDWGGNTFAWQPATPGLYGLQVTAHDATCNLTYSAYAYYTVLSPALTGIAAIIASPPSGVALDALPPDGITLTAVPQGTGEEATYCFNGQRKVIAEDKSVSWEPFPISAFWSSDPVQWTPTVAGTYVITAIARDATCNTSFRKSVTYLVRPVTLRGVALAADPPSGVVDDAIPAGGITLTATPDGGDASAEYFFSAKLKDVQADGSYRWVAAPISADWGGPTCRWTPAAPGLYVLTVRAREGATPSTCSATLVYTVRSAAVTGIASIQLTSAIYPLGNPMPSQLTYTVFVDGSGTGVLYRYRVSTWNGTGYVDGPLTDYTTASSFDFAPPGPGVYRIWGFAYDPTYNTVYSKPVGCRLR